MEKQVQNAINAIRILSIDAIQNANSGHPGLPLGTASMSYELWANHMNHNPMNPQWRNRDRFILSAGHGSMLIYSLLHLFGYNDVSLDEVKKFRSLGSKTPGHPEYGITEGVEATTGPLGAGFATAVGIAAAEAHLASKFNKPDCKIVDHYTYVVAGDGCLMEGISSEAASLAGTWGLGKFIVLYDSNHITIEGSTDIAFTEDVAMKYKAMGFQILEVADGNDIEEVGRAIQEAKKECEKPSLIIVNNIIGYGCEKKEGTASAHGDPLGEENVELTRKRLNWNIEERFIVPEETYAHYRTLAKKGADKEKEWNEILNVYKEKYPEDYMLFEEYYSCIDSKKIYDNELFWKRTEDDEASRVSSGVIINQIKDMLPNFVGGAADVGPSTRTYMNGAGDFSKEDYSGRNFHFGIREMAMAAIGNGLYLHGGLRPFVSCFFVFSDFMKPIMRLSALMKIPMIYVFTHDSIGVGEDGPTHQPIEQLNVLRSMPEFVSFRPADRVETAAGYYWGLTDGEHPIAMVLSRQDLPSLKMTSKEAVNGGYILVDSKKDVPDLILIATGSEVSLAVKAQEELSNRNIDARVVSMPSTDIFDLQSNEYKEKVLPNNVRRRIAIEAMGEEYWYKYVGLDGKVIGMKSFGESAPGKQLYEFFGITVENIVKEAVQMMES